MARRGTLIAVVGLLAACSAIAVVGMGQFGRPIPIASDPAAPLPRMAVRLGDENCGGPAGGCDSLCEGPPGTCPDGACALAIIDSGTPFTVLAADEGSFDVARECLEVREASGLHASSDMALLDHAIARFRFDQLPLVRAPGEDAAGWEWIVGDDLDPVPVGAVIGGNLLRNFAVALRHHTGEEPTVTFFDTFPGHQDALADQGRVYLRLQYPGALLGRLVDDRCEVGGIDCELDELDLTPGDEVLVYEDTRMLVDACVAPPPCGLDWPADTPADEGSCRMRIGPGLEECSEELGSSASLVVATGMPGLVLFADSAAAILGPLDGLPDCGALPADEEFAACVEAQDAVLHAPGWEPHVDLLRLRVRSLGVVAGNTGASGPAPCERLRDRLVGLHDQCRKLADRKVPFHPRENDDQRADYAGVVRGEVSWVEGQSGPDTAAWIPTLVLPEDAPLTIATRRDVGSAAVQPDGFVGSVLLDETELVLDYTEDEDKPGVRVTCLEPSAGDCLGMPSCTSEGEDTSSAAPGKDACCWGVPDELLEQIVLEGLGEEAPRESDRCCDALAPDTRTALEEMELCSG